MIEPAKIPGCAKKLAVRSSPRSMMNTSLPVGVSMPGVGLPVTISLLPGFTKSISFKSPPLNSASESSEIGCLSSVFCRQKKTRINSLLTHSFGIGNSMETISCY